MNRALAPSNAMRATCTGRLSTGLACHNGHGIRVTHGVRAAHLGHAVLQKSEHEPRCRGDKTRDRWEAVFPGLLWAVGVGREIAIETMDRDLRLLPNRQPTS